MKVIKTPQNFCQTISLNYVKCASNLNEYYYVIETEHI